MSAEQLTKDRIQDIIDETNNLEQVEKAFELVSVSGPRLNRKQKRYLKKKQGQKNVNAINEIAATTKKLNYINLIQGLRKLNEKRRQEDNERSTEENVPVCD